MTDTSGREKMLEEALRPFAEYADKNRRLPADHIITQGSRFAKRQLTMSDCYAAADALASPSTQEPALRGEKVEEKRTENLQARIDLLLRHCRDYECSTCAVIMCPHGDDLHFHHDGCPSCFTLGTDSDGTEPVHPAAAAALRTYAGESAAQSERAGLERAAAVAEKEADDAREQIEHNNEYARRSGSDGSAANEACRKTIYVAERIAEGIRALASPSTQEPTLRGGKVEEIAREIILICLPGIEIDKKRFADLMQKTTAALRTRAGESAARLVR